MARMVSIIAIFLAAIAIATATGVAGQETPSPIATPFDCPITQPNGNEPPIDANVFGRGNGDFGNDALWTSLWIWGDGIVQVPNDEHLQPDGSVIEMKWAWYRYVPGKLTIEGHRLDAPAPPLEAWVPDGYGDQGFQVSGITFPSNGCWEITGRVGSGSLTFVVLVVWPQDFTPAATPVPQSSPTN